MASTIVGLFDTFPAAQAAVQDLVSTGIPREEISITSNNATGEHRLDAGTGEGHGTHAGSGAATGAGIGAVVGGVGGLLVGMGLLAIPGIGPILAAGPLAAALAGAGIGAVTGGLLGALVGMGIPEEDAHAYAEGVRRGGTLVTVSADDGHSGPVADILNRHGAVDIDTRATEWRGRGWGGFRHDAQPLTGEDIVREREYATPGAQTLAAGQEGEIRVPVTEEELAVGTRPVQRGGVRIYRRVEETPVQEQVQLREEHVTVDRRPVDRPITEADRDAFQERTYEVREMAEEPVVAKQARVAEEVVIRKDVDTRTETVSDTVRRTDVDVQQVGSRDYDAWDQSFRQDFTTRYAGTGGDYNTYAPAYRYGYDLANDPRYSGREWNDIETNVRSDWDSRGIGAWDRFKDSVRYAWERARSNRRMDRAA
jgi:stress response protein YsnF